MTVEQITRPVTAPVYMPLNEVGEFFGVSPRTIDRWIASGRLPHFRTPGGRVRVRAADVHALRNR